MSAIELIGVPAARARLARLVAGLKSAASGEVVERAAEKVGEQVRAISERVISRHTDSGASAADTVVDVGGGAITLHGMPPCKGKKWAGKSYLSTFSWWPFRRGMPLAVVKRASLIFARELLVTLGAEAPAEAGAIVLEAETAEVAKAARAVDAAKRRQNKKLARWFRQARKADAP